MREMELFWRRVGVVLGIVVAACSNRAPSASRTGPAPHEGPSVRFDFTAGLESLPWPNDTLCWLDSSGTGPCQPNLASASLNVHQANWVRAINATTGWANTGSIVVPFARSPGRASGAAIDLARLVALQSDDDWSNDAIYLIDLTTGIPKTLAFASSNGAFILRDAVALDPSDPRKEEPSLTVETISEVFGNAPTTGVASFTESGRELYRQDWDTDSDGQLDVAALRPGDICPKPITASNASPSDRVLRDRCLADELIAAYDLASNTLRLHSRSPLAENREYAVVIMDRLVDDDEQPVVSPFSEISHPRQIPAAERAIHWLRSPELEKYFGPVADDPYGHARFVWTFTAGSPSSQLRTLAKSLAPDAFTTSESSSRKARLSVEREYDLDAPCVGTSSRGALASFLREALSLSATQEAAVQSSFGAIGRVAIGSFRYPRDATGAQTLAKSGEGSSDVLVPFWLVIPRHISTTKLRVVITNQEQGKPQFEGLRWAGHWARLGLATIGLVRRGSEFTMDDSALSQLTPLFEQSCLNGLLADLLRKRSTDTLTRLRNDIDPDVVMTRDHWRNDAIELAAFAHALQFANLPPELSATAFVGVGTGAATAALAATLTPQTPTLVMIDPATSPERAWGRAATWGGPERALWRVFGPRLAGVPVAALGDADTRCKAVDVSIRIFNADTTSMGAEVGCLPLANIDGPAFPNGATVVATNLSSLSRRCVAMTPTGRFSLGLPAEAKDAIELAIYDSLDVVARLGRDGDCTPHADRNPMLVLGTADEDPFGTSIVTTAAGLGLERQTSELLRTLDLAAAAFAPANPATFVAHLAQPEAPTASHGLLLAVSPGDPIVPPDEGLTLARAARLIPRFPPENLATHWELADDTTPAIASALAKPTAAARVAWSHLDEGTPRLRRFPASTSACGSNLTADLEIQPACSVDPPDTDTCAETLPDLDALSGTPSPFGAVQPIPSLRLARYAGRPTAKNLTDLWSPQSRVIGPSVQPTHPSWPFVAMAVPLTHPRGAHGIAHDDICQRFRFGTYVSNLVGQFIATSGTDYPPVTHRDTQHCLMSPSTCSFLSTIE